MRLCTHLVLLASAALPRALGDIALDGCAETFVTTEALEVTDVFIADINGDSVNDIVAAVTGTDDVVRRSLCCSAEMVLVVVAVRFRILQTSH